MADILQRHGHVIIEQNPNGSYNVYPAPTPIVQGVSLEMACAYAAQVLPQPVGMPSGFSGTPGASAVAPATESMLPEEDRSDEAKAIIQTGNQIDGVPLWSGDPRIYVVRIPVRLAKNFEELKANPRKRSGKRVSADEARKMVTKMFAKTKDEPKGDQIEVKYTTFKGAPADKNSDGQRVYWSYRVRLGSTYQKNADGFVISRDVKLPNGAIVEIAQLKRQSGGATVRRKLRGTPRYKPFADALRKIVESMAPEPIAD